MLRPDTILRKLRRLGRKLQRTARSATRWAGGIPFADSAVILQPKPIPVAVRRTHRR